jgi:hypothetical protein
MEYRIVQHEGKVAVHKVVSENGKIHVENLPAIEAQDLKELQKKIMKLNEAFWKPTLTAAG